ncbi:MAG: hypothetical protein RI101_07470 [Nitrospira sp.]|nr:hypothetical protein [Nitrospira sp.]
MARQENRIGRYQYGIAQVKSLIIDERGKVSAGNDQKEERQSRKKWGGDGHITSPTSSGPGETLGTKKAAKAAPTSYHEHSSEIMQRKIYILTVIYQLFTLYRAVKIDPI